MLSPFATALCISMTTNMQNVFMNGMNNDGSPLSIVDYGVDICQGRVGNGYGLVRSGDMGL
jgi:hypothetical protein